MTDSSLALNPFQVSSESPLDSLQNICSHATGISPGRITPGVASALFTTTWGKPEKDRNAEGDRERQRLMSSSHLKSTWNKPCTHENQPHSLNFPVSRSHKLPFYLLKSV